MLRLENTVDGEYPALRGFRPTPYDDGSGSYLSMLRGAPQTVLVSYRQRF